MNMNNDATEFDSIVHRNLHRKKVGLGSLGFLSFLGITMGVLILMAMAAPSARAALETYYDFEDGNFTSDSPGLQPTSIAPFIGSFTFPAGTGTTVNAVTPITTNTALTIHSQNSAGVFLLGGLTTTGLTDVHLSFALLSAATGGSFTDLVLTYSTTGASGPYTFFASEAGLTSHTSYNPAFTYDVSALSGGAVDGVSGNNLFFQFFFNGATNADAATFIDNIQVTAVPEPSSYIGALFGLVGLCWFQRRWFMRLLGLRSA
jgi:PEP-CTERM motif